MFDENLKMVSLKIYETLGLLQNLQNMPPRSAPITLVKLLSAPIFYDPAYNMPFHQKQESTQYNACLAITGAMWGTSKEKVYQDLGLESL